MVDEELLACITLSCATPSLTLNMLPKGTHLSVDTCVNLWKDPMVCMGPKTSRLVMHRTLMDIGLLLTNEKVNEQSRGTTFRCLSRSQSGHTTARERNKRAYCTLSYDSNTRLNITHRVLRICVQRKGRKPKVLTVHIIRIPSMGNRALQNALTAGLIWSRFANAGPRSSIGCGTPSKKFGVSTQKPPESGQPGENT